VTANLCHEAGLAETCLADDGEDAPLSLEEPVHASPDCGKLGATTHKGRADALSGEATENLGFFIEESIGRDLLGVIFRIILTNWFYSNLTRYDYLREGVVRSPPGRLQRAHMMSVAAAMSAPFAK